MRKLVANALYWLFDHVCALTGHASGCWVFRWRHPLRWLTNWAQDVALFEGPKTYTLTDTATTTYSALGGSTTDARTEQLWRQ